VNKETKKPMNAGNWMGACTALGALVFVLTSEPVWIGVGVAIGAALDWKRPKNKE
jgi:drug/metabolite transporter (DMT)-like permease